MGEEKHLWLIGSSINPKRTALCVARVGMRGVAW